MCLIFDIACSRVNAEKQAISHKQQTLLLNVPLLFYHASLVVVVVAAAIVLHVFNKVTFSSTQGLYFVLTFTQVDL